MEVELAALFAQTSTRYRLIMVDMIKVTSIEQLENLTVAETKAKRKCKCFGLLSPKLAESVNEMDMKITSVFIKIVQKIKASIIPIAEGAAEETEEDILTRISAPYDNPLYFLWPSHKFPGDAILQPKAAIHDRVSLDWDKQTREACLRTPPQLKIVDLSDETPRTSFPDGAIAVMTSLSRSMIEAQKSTQNKQEEMNDSRFKS